MAEQRPGRVLGVGGVFFRSKNPERLAKWYAEHLGLEVESWGGPQGTHFLPSAMPESGFTVWSVFPDDTEYFGERRQAFMLNLVVDDLDAALESVVAGGAERLPGTEDHDYGRFGWFTDPDGNRVELWEPPEGDDDDG